MKRLVALMTILAILLLTVSGCSQKPDSSNSAARPEGGEDIKLTFWCTALYTPEETKRPQEEWVISQLIKEFETQNPGVTIELSILEQSPEVFAKFKAAALSKSGPDLINLWSGTYLFDLQQVLLPLNDYIPAEDKAAITAWDAVSYNFDPNGDILAYPLGINYGVMLYNKELVAAAGLDFDTNPPANTDELTAALLKIKETGVIPMVQDAQNGSMIMHASGYWWAQGTGYENLVKLGNGETKYAGDKGLTDMLAYCAKLYELGLINVDAATSVNSNSRFLNGEAAIRTGGTWDINDTQDALGEGNFGILALPSFSGATNPYVQASVLGGAGDCTAVASYTKHPEMAAKFVSFLSSKESSIAISKNMGSFPARNDISTEELGWSDELHKQMVEFSQNTAFWIDNSLPAEHVGELMKYFPNMLVGKMTAMELAEAMDKKVAELG